MEEEELIITSYPYEGTDIHNEPSLPSLSTLNQSSVPLIPSPPVVDYKHFDTPTTQLVAVQEDIPPTQEEQDESFFSPDVIMRWISDDSNKLWSIHTIADIVLFYMFLRFIQHQFNETETLICNTRNDLNELKKQYGLE
jgi:hypothetical protein